MLSQEKIWNINTIVYLYNCCSLVSLLPIDGYDLSKISKEIITRYAVEGEMFWSLGEKKATPTRKNHLVYADQTDVMCWLWNHKDSQKTCIDEKTKQVIFFVDSFQSNQVRSALELLSSYLDEIKCNPKELGILNSKTSQVRLRSLS